MCIKTNQQRLREFIGQTSEDIPIDIIAPPIFLGKSDLQIKSTKCNACNYKCSHIYNVEIITSTESKQLQLGVECYSKFMGRKRRNKKDINNKIEQFRLKCSSCDKCNLISRCRYNNGSERHFKYWVINPLLCGTCDYNNNILVRQLSELESRLKPKHIKLGKRYGKILNPINRESFKNIFDEYERSGCNPNKLKSITSLIVNVDKYFKNKETIIKFFLFVICKNLVINKDDCSVAFAMFLPIKLIEYILSIDNITLFSYVGGTGDCLIIEE